MFERRIMRGAAAAGLFASAPMNHLPRRIYVRCQTVIPSPRAQAQGALRPTGAAEYRLTIIENHLIELLPQADRRSLLAVCEPVQFVISETLAEPETVTQYLYFPVNGFASLVTQLNGKPILEVGMVGREGMLGIQAALGVQTVPLHALVQGAGEAWRVRVAPFRRVLESSPALRRIVDRYLYVLMAQFASSAACIRFHEIDQRLARWLLMTRDRAHTDRFRVTHEFLAYMLGVRRVGITTAASALQRRGLIEYHRGDVTVIDVRGLKRCACSCYAADRRTYDLQLGGM
jgi:CRP-like cAMP-binding protein